MTSYKDNKTKPNFKASTDGLDHINIHPASKTELGKALSHFSDIGFTHPYLGHFRSMEGIWHYIRSTTKVDELRSKVGFEAKKIGKALTIRKFPEFHSVIMDANYHKIIQNPSLYEEFINSELPFDHYYVFDKSNVQVRPTGFDFLIEGFESIRSDLKAGITPEPLNYEEIFNRVFVDRDA